MTGPRFTVCELEPRYPEPWNMPWKGHETYIRVEAVDKYGRTAWTNPIYLEW
ncbi:MAG: hypothetical protein ACLRZZ_23900 [Enterocloster sp.]